MGAEAGGAPQAALGKPLSPHLEIGAREGYRLWSAAYDDAPNALLALEMRTLSVRLGDVRGQRILDAGSGTGRWMQWAQARGAYVFGIDACHEMVLKAEQKAGLGGRSALADVRGIPLRDNAVDCAICSFTMGYLPSPGSVLRELARVSRCVIVSDLHPDAVRAGWTRSFRAGAQTYRFLHYEHSMAELDDCARRAGLTPCWRVEAALGEPEREIFRQAGRESVFDEVCLLPAVLITLWQK
jgi:malonyl-CoA O-methyltransferase